MCKNMKKIFKREILITLKCLIIISAFLSKFPMGVREMHRYIDIGIDRDELHMNQSVCGRFISLFIFNYNYSAFFPQA